jgi:hypothetical protein
LPLRFGWLHEDCSLLPPGGGLAQPGRS